MKRQRVVGEVPQVLTPDQKLESLRKFRNQATEIEEQLMRGVMTTGDIQALIDHQKPQVCCQEDGPKFTIINKESTAIESSFNFDAWLASAGDRFLLSECFVSSFNGYKTALAESARLVICELEGSFRTPMVLTAVGKHFKLSLPNFLWAVRSNLVEEDKGYVAFVTAPDGLDRCLSVRKGRHIRTSKIEIACHSVGRVGTLLNHSRLIGCNCFQPE